MKLRKELTPEQKGGIIACNKLGITQEKIAEVVECTQSAVSRFLSSKTFIKKRTGRPPSNIHELEEMVTEEWAAIPKESYRNLIKSMPRRIQAVISAEGGHTKY